jgi:hypothetical protein
MTVFWNFVPYSLVEIDRRFKPLKHEERARESGPVVRDTTFNIGETELILRLWRSPGSARSSF